ncbi:hypothetical protein [Endozoicomonas ascidiicola]|uniref:hypothetical protein n=1 Tax=Endozoicomonas ascidiicola TaxID=1698521 RepID=UPI000830A602|nr:hypothetical protein [Endozoicomonas ascidiicola]
MLGLSYCDFERAADEIFTAIPIISFPAPASGNTSKLKIAVAMLKVVREELKDRMLPAIPAKNRKMDILP